jgi:hypothetical protein
MAMNMDTRGAVLLRKELFYYFGKHNRLTKEHFFYLDDIIKTRRREL